MSLSEQDARLFWERLRKQQIKVGIRNLKEICRKEGISYQTLINQKCSDRYPAATTIAILAKSLNCSTDWLLTGKEFDNAGTLSQISEKVQKVIDILQQID